MKTSSARPRPRPVGRSEPLKWRVSDAMWERLAPMLTDPPAASATPAGPATAPASAWKGSSTCSTPTRPGQLWADRGYASAALERALRERAIEPRISKPRRAGEPIPAGTLTREVWRGKKRRLKTPDPQARHRWPVERTNAWLKALRRIATRRDRKASNYLASLELGMIVILLRSF